MALLRRAKLRNPKYEKDLVYLYQFPRSPCIPNVSPYCLKLETWLRMKNIAYENKKYSPFVKSTQGYLPFVALNGRQIADSSLIIRELSANFCVDDAKKADAETWAYGRALEVFTEYTVLPTVIYFRYHHTPQSSEEFFDKQNSDARSFIPWLPKFLWPFFMNALKRKTRTYLTQNGLLVSFPEIITEMSHGYLKHMSEFLGSRRYFVHDDVATEVDATVFGVLSQFLYLPMSTPPQTYLKSDCKNLVKFCDEIRGQFWPDWDEICKTRDINTHRRK